MKVLLLHPEDRLLPGQPQEWDLIVDLGRAPAATYEVWSRQANCRVVSLYQCGRGFEDLYRFKQTIHRGNGFVVDKYGIDWWDVVLPILLPYMERCFMLMGLAKELDSSAKLFCSRPDAHARALQKFLGIDCHLLEGGSSAFTRKLRHYKEALSFLDFGQLSQIVQDKFDPEHSIRRRLASKKPSTGKQVFLLPTAYINVSRMAVSYAALVTGRAILAGGCPPRREAKVAPQ